MAEMEAFKMLITVSGVGPKAAIAVLSELSTDKLALQSLRRTLRQSPALTYRQETAERIVFEFRKNGGHFARR
jgi:Holliday junction DNA helicase RuvA